MNRAPNVGPDPATDLSILLVHGIGRHKPGSIVDHVGNAWLEWFEARLAGSGRTIEVEHALLKPSERGDGGPARVTLLVRDAKGDPERRLRLVESLWASEFDPPGFLGVLRWVLGPGAWLLFRHVVNLPARVCRRRPPKMPIDSVWMRLLSGLIGVLALFAVVLPIQLIGMLLALLSIVPIEQLRTRIESLLLIVSEVIGDSYLFARNPVVRRSLADRVHRDLDALRTEGAPVVVMAHSQGAAVAFEMLERHAEPPPLVTYGSGIRKLHELVGDAAGSATVPPVFHVLWAVAALWVAALVGLIIDIQRTVAGVIVFDQWAGMSWLVMLVLYIIGFVLGSVAADRSREVDNTLGERIRSLLARQPAWLDLYATHDLVPAGPLVAQADYFSAPSGLWRALPTRSLDSFEIVNRMQTWTDHVSYWINPDGFIDCVVEWLRREMNQDWLPQAVTHAPAWCSRRHRARLRVCLSVILQVEVVVLWWRTRGVWRDLLPTAQTTAQAIVDRLPDGIPFAQPVAGSATLYSYGFVTLLLTLVLHFAALALYDTLALGRVWQGLDMKLALHPPDDFRGWLSASVRLLILLAFFGLAAVSLAFAVIDASYTPLVRVPMDVLLALHRFAFVGDLPAVAP